MSPVKVKFEREVLWSSFLYFGDFEYLEWRARISNLAVFFCTNQHGTGHFMN